MVKNIVLDMIYNRMKEIVDTNYYESLKLRKDEYNGDLFNELKNKFELNGYTVKINEYQYELVICISNNQ